MTPQRSVHLHLSQYAYIRRLKNVFNAFILFVFLPWAIARDNRFIVSHGVTAATAIIAVATGERGGGGGGKFV